MHKFNICTTMTKISNNNYYMFTHEVFYAFLLNVGKWSVKPKSSIHLHVSMTVGNSTGCATVRLFHNIIMIWNSFSHISHLTCFFVSCKLRNTIWLFHPYPLIPFIATWFHMTYDVERSVNPQSCIHSSS